MSLYTSALRPVLFGMDAEQAHDLAKIALRTDWPWRAFAGARREVPGLAVTLGGLRLANPFCLSPGFDKNAEAFAGLLHLGFGAITVGSILPVPRAGNPKPRLLRYPAENALGNCYGLPSDGVEVCAARLRAAAGRARTTPVFANIDAPTIPEYVRSFEMLEPLVDGIELGLQCPNNRDDHGEFHDPAVFEALLGEITKRRRKPLFIKLALPVDDKDMDNRIDLAMRAARLGVDGVNVPGIFKREEPNVSLGVATVSGAPTLPRTLRIVRDLAAATKGRIAIRANGGIMSGADALHVIMAGATSIDILSAFIYRGWRAAPELCAELATAMREAGLASLDELKGRAAAARGAAEHNLQGTYRA